MSDSEEFELDGKKRELFVKALRQELLQAVEISYDFSADGGVTVDIAGMQNGTCHAIAQDAAEELGIVVQSDLKREAFRAKEELSKEIEPEERIRPCYKPSPGERPRAVILPPTPKAKQPKTKKKAQPKTKHKN